MAVIKEKMMNILSGWTKSFPTAARAASLFIAVAAAVTTTAAQEASSNRLPAPPTADELSEDQAVTPDIRIRSNLVVTPVTVINPDGEFIFALSRDDFEIFDNGIPQRIETFESEPRKMAVVVVVQTNRTVEALIKDIHPLASVISSMLLGPEGEAAVITFGDRVNVVQDFSASDDELETTFTKIGPEGIRARLNDALMRAIAMLEQRQQMRRIILVFSQGTDEASRSRREEVVRRATGAEVAIYGLSFNPIKGLLTRRPEVSGPGPMELSTAGTLPGGVPTSGGSSNFYRAPIPIVDILDATGQMVKSTIFKNLMEYYAGYTGGVFYADWKKGQLDDMLSRIAAEVHSQYELAYIPSTPAKPGFHRISVKVLKDGLKVRTRAGYFYQPSIIPAKPAADKPTAASGTP